MSRCEICSTAKPVARAFKVEHHLIREILLCDPCLKKARAEAKIFSWPHISQDLLKGLGGEAREILAGEGCPVCGITFERYVAAESPGDCRYCARFFGPVLDALELRILQMKERLEALIRDDRFEEARRVSDRINGLGL